jgi:MYXO-CTERM domain-containing protein
MGCRDESSGARATRRRKRITRTIASACLAASFWSAPARADGGIPRAYNILFEPGNPSHIVVRSQYWGLFDGHAGSSSWSLLCSQAYGGRALDPDNYATVVAQGGRILVAAQFSGLNVSDDNCNWRQIDAFNGEAVQGIAPMDATGTSFVAVTVLGSKNGVVSRVYTSSDRGDTWSPVKGTIPMNVSMANVAVAPSDRKRIYVVGVAINGGPRQIAVSKDGGDSFITLSVGDISQYDPTLIKPLSVAGIVPNDPDTLFVRADGGDFQGAMADDEIWVSNDAGATWKPTLRAMSDVPGLAAYNLGDVPGFAFTPDGKYVLVSGPNHGILQASLADAVNLGERAAYRNIYAHPVWGLAFQGNDLYAGNDDYNMTPSFTVGVSSNAGYTFQKVMTKCDVGFPTCAGTSTMEKVCREQWTRQGGYVTDYLENACMQSVPPTSNTGGAVSGAGGSATVIGAGAAGGTTGSTPRDPSGDAGPADAGANLHVPVGTDIGRHVGLKSLKCSVDASRSPANDMTTWFAAGAFAALGAVRRRRPGALGLPEAGSPEPCVSAPIPLTTTAVPPPRAGADAAGGPSASGPARSARREPP